MFGVDLHQPGIEIHRIEMLNGAKDFCQVFMTDVRVPDIDRVSEIDDGWTVGIRWLFHERSLASGSPYATRPATVERLHAGSGAAGATSGFILGGRPVTHTSSGTVTARHLERTTPWDDTVTVGLSAGSAALATLSDVAATS